jgi:hypothetical protein
LDSIAGWQWWRSEFLESDLAARPAAFNHRNSPIIKVLHAWGQAWPRSTGATPQLKEAQVAG